MAYAGLKPQYLKQMMKEAKGGPVAFAFGEDADGRDVLVLDARLDPGEVCAKFKTATGCARPAHGTCRINGTALELTPVNTVKGLRARVTELAKREKWPVKQARVIGEDAGPAAGRGLELDTTGAPPTPPAPTGKGKPVPVDGDEDVRPAEIISGASGMQYTAGEVTNRTGLEGGDFASGARENARQNDHRGVGTLYKGGVNPMQSANLGGEFAVRHGIGFLCVKYTAKGLPPLDDIADYAKPNSAYLAGFRGLAESRQLSDPSSADILAGIQEAVVKLAKAVPKGAQGELVVSFQGHGFNGSIFGVDGVEIPSAKLLGLARAAAKARVSLTYVLDGCFTGNAVAGFQEDAAEVVERRAAKAGLPAERVARIKGVLAFGRELVHFSRAVGAHSVDMAKAVAKGKAAESESTWARLAAINGAIGKDLAAMRAQWENNRAGAVALSLDTGPVDRSLAGLAAELASRGEGMSFDAEDWVALVGAFQDRVSDAANDLIEAAAAAAKKTGS